MKIVKRKIDTLISPDYNPRKKLMPEDSEYQKIKRSVETFGYVDPIIYNQRNNHIVGGNQRWQVLKDLGFTTVDAVQVDLDDNDERLLNIALNKISGDWNMELLNEVLLELDAAGADFTLSGFDVLPGNLEEPLEEWTGMPEYESEDQQSLHHIVVHFKTEADLREFEKLVGQTLTEKTRSIWFPPVPNADMAGFKYV